MLWVGEGKEFYCATFKKLLDKHIRECILLLMKEKLLLLNHLTEH